MFVLTNLSFVFAVVVDDNDDGQLFVAFDGVREPQCEKHLVKHSDVHRFGYTETCKR